MSEKRLVTLRLRAGTLTAEVSPEETEDVLAALTRWYGKYWIAYVKDDTGRLRSWGLGVSFCGGPCLNLHCREKFVRRGFWVTAPLAMRFGGYCCSAAHVCFWHKANIPITLIDVRFRG